MASKNGTVETPVAALSGRREKRARFSCSDTFQQPVDPVENKEEAEQLNVLEKTVTEGCVTNQDSASVIPVPTVAVAGRINCLQAVHFHPVRTEADIHCPPARFSPLFVHHFFGRKEEIYGFSELAIRLFYTVDTLELFLKVDAVRHEVATASKAWNPEGQNTPIASSGRSLGINSGVACHSGLNDESSDNQTEVASGNGADGGVSSDGHMALTRVLGYLSKVAVPGGFHLSLGSFLEAVTSDVRKRFKPPGVLIDRFSLPSKADTETVDYLELYKCSFDEAFVSNAQEACAYHRRVEWFLHYFIDACSNIEQDKHWRVLFLFKTTTEKQQGSQSATVRPFYELAGIVTLYTFFALPRARRRISQFMVLPHLQGNGIGLEVLRRVYRDAIEDSDVGEITVEDPARSFAQLRDVVGLLMSLERRVVTTQDVLGLPTSETENTQRLNNNVPVDSAFLNNAGSSLPDASPFLSHEFRLKLKKEVKECRTQVRRLTEIICLASLLPANKEQSNELSASAPVNSNKIAIPKAPTAESRDWRAPSSDTPDTSFINAIPSDFQSSDLCKELRLATKKRLRKENIEFFSQLSHEDQRLELQRMWEAAFESYCRTIQRVRRFLVSSPQNAALGQKQS